MKILFPLTVLFLITSLYSSAQVISFKNLFQDKKNIQKDYHDIVSGYQLLQLDNQKLSSARAAIAQKIEIVLPFENSDLALDLNPVKITSANFSVIEGVGKGINRPVA